MMILYGFGTFRPLSRAQVWAAGYLISTHGAAGDLRGAIAALALRSLAALEALIERQLVLLARTIMVRAWHGARFAADMTHADTMVAAGGGYRSASFQGKLQGKLQGKFQGKFQGNCKQIGSLS